MLRSRLKLRQLATLVAVAQAGSLRRAAAALRVSQPALSKALRELESVFGRRLFEREARGLRATPHGAAVVDYARRLLRDVEALSATLEAVDSGAGGRLRIGVIPFLPLDWLQAVLESLLQGQPAIAPQVMEGGTDLLVEWLRRRDLDCMVGRMTPALAGDDLETRRVFDQTLRVVARSGHPLLRRRGKLALEDLVGWDWILPARSTPTRQAVDRVFVEAGLPVPRARLESYSLQIFQRFVPAGDALAAIPEDTAQRWIRLGELKALPFRWAVPAIFTVWLKRDDDSPLIRRFAEAAGRACS
ncbi:MAG TPA: LysR substrate-binding domain-containing protein [Burkholderiales bacterium]